MILTPTFRLSPTGIPYFKLCTCLHGKAFSSTVYVCDDIKRAIRHSESYLLLEYGRNECYGDVVVEQVIRCN